MKSNTFIFKKLNFEAYRHRTKMQVSCTFFSEPQLFFKYYTGNINEKLCDA